MMIQNNCMWFLLLFLNVSFKQGSILVKIPDPLHGIVGTPAVWATMEDAILSPRAHIAPSGGPVIIKREIIHPQLIHTAKEQLEGNISPHLKVGKIIGLKF